MKLQQLVGSNVFEASVVQQGVASDSKLIKVRLAADSPAAGALGRSASSPVLTTWEKPWEEPLGLALHRNGRRVWDRSLEFPLWLSASLMLG